MRCCCAVVFGVGLAGSALADLKLAPLFTDHMVLQREAACPVWGWERPGVEVTVRGSWGGEATATADEHGRWRADLQTPGAGGPFEVTVQGETGRTLRDVWVGEVWLASGQSNMEWPLSATDHAEEDIAGAEAPHIRFFTVPNAMSLHPRVEVEGQWRAVTPEMAAGISAVGYHFARSLSAEDPRLGAPVPVGIIAADVGGTRIEAWMDAGTLREFPECAGELEQIELLKDPVAREPLMADAATAWWDRLDALPFQPGHGWTGPGFDDSSWGAMELPASWSGDLGNFDGIVRFRRSFEIGGLFQGRPLVLELGPIDDRDDVWINGTYIGGTRSDGAWQVSRRYEVPAEVLWAGENTISVRVYDTGGLGGINGRPEQMRLRLAQPRGVVEERGAIPLAGEWKFQRGTATAQLPPQTQAIQVNWNTATALYNAMVHPLVPFKVRGVIWYQGESNRGNAGRYADLMRAWVGQWRAAFEDEAMPFLWVQIAPYGYQNDRGETVALREAQAAATDVAHTAMVVTTDIGDNADIHPGNKREVGRRLALLALRHVYGLPDIHASGPEFGGTMEVGADGSMRLDLRNSADGLFLRPSPAGFTGFEVAGEDRRFHAASVRVEGTSVILSSPGVPTPVAARFNWTRSPEASLLNTAGLPAAPFRTDDWETGTVAYAPGSYMMPLRLHERGIDRLFNGTDLSGWTFVNSDNHTWSVASDDAGPYIRCTGVPTGVMRTDRQYENFVLEMEYRHLVPGGNAGLFVWSDPLPVRGAPFTRSVEVQVMDGQEGNGFTSDGDIFPIWGAVMTPENGRQGSSRAFPTERRTNPAPMWNHYRVECVDGRISLAVNGKVVTRGHSISPRRGYICLESEGTEIHFRNIRIKELPATQPPLAEEHVAMEAAGWRPLYNGVNFEGWKFGPEHEGHWTAADWRIAFDGQGSDLWTTESFGDFELICDWRWTGQAVETARPVILPDGSVELNEDGSQATVMVMDAGDSGIYLRGSSKSQVNMWCWPIGSGEVYGYRTDGAMPADVRAGVTPRVVADAPIGQWNRFKIRMVGDRLTVELNGVVVIEEAVLPGVAADGPIALQMHGNPIEFANIYVRKID